ncbi:MKI67 FHA domain-interacting nucleolar phosphoprotein [Entomortierella chlamydospora]|uniref:MKI67 FHA domain-interacting nucleolar phosphoprotein n=1 Tax=Entomortierella chlamydospora TaxID=101097 RepID=A0A9P6MXI4_9FUNG|nr:MKI67 FHA domain-interacting nucleolar phosphoprotein [Entomortierella chlamydospora]KAG0016823.1 MKI67 FHA domain-interacting nucleolar phosphoprotein [Entomortierella chlamydospora]
MAAATRASSASAKAAAKPAPAASTGTKRKATAPAVKETPAKKVAVTPTKKETKSAPASKKIAAEKKSVEEKKPVEKKVAEKKAVEKKPVEKKPVEKKTIEKKPAEKKTVEKKPAEKKTVEKKPAEKKVVEKKTPAPKKTTGAQPKAVEAPSSKKEQKEEEDEDDDNEDEEEQLMDDNALLKDIDSSADEDESDDENEEDKAAMKEDTFASMKDEISLNPKAAAAIKKIGALGQPKDKNTTGVVYLGRIPHGFYEEQMKAYFTQFGKVLRLRLSRNKKTGKSKHYAFIEFASQEVAEIVADTMDNYLLFGHLLKCKALHPSQIHPAMFLGANKRFKPIPWLKISKEKHNAEKTVGQSNQIKRKLLRNEAAKRAKLAELGIDYEFPGYKASVQEKPKHTKF